MSKSTLLTKAEETATSILRQFPEEMSYHNYDCSRMVVDAAKSIGGLEGLNDDDLEVVLLAAWFQNTGFRDIYEGYEEKSKVIAQEFLKSQNVAEAKISAVVDCMAIVEERQEPKGVNEKVLLDANKIYLKKEHYKKVLEGMRSELAIVKKETYTDAEWLQHTLETIARYKFHTSYGRTILAESKEGLRTRLEKKRGKLQKKIDLGLLDQLGVTPGELKALKKKLQKAEGRPERGIETMFRLTSKNHIDLSGMADSKANIMISVNSIILSILIGGLLPKLDSNPHLVVPTIILLVVNLTSMICSIISIRPNVTTGLFTTEDVKNQRTNLLFFGNFHKMTRDDYHWGMNQLMSNSSFLYSSLIDDIYFLGVVLARKYKFLRFSYNIFMIGIVISVVAFVIANFMVEPIVRIPSTGG